MPLSFRLLQVDLTLECKYCGHAIIKKGGWFKQPIAFSARDVNMKFR